MTWWRRSMCLLRADAMLFSDNLIVASLSSLKGIGCRTLMPISFKTIIIQITSFSAVASARYSALVVLCVDTPGCSLDLYVRRFPLSVIKNPVRDLRVLGQDAWDASTQTSIIHRSLRVLPDLANPIPQCLYRCEGPCCCCLPPHGRAQRFEP